ncbi:FAD-dependent oxidoreductase [Kutzneria viridogrisea]
MTSMRDDVLVLGAGVIGLTTAVCLAEAGLRVRVLAAEPPVATTSVAAGAMWGPAFAEPAEQVLGWSRTGLAEFTALAGDETTGVSLVRGRMAARFPLPLDGELPPQVAVVPELADCLPEELPEGYLSGQWCRVPLIDMPRYLRYLTGRLRSAGGTLEIRSVARLLDLVDLAPVLVNCAGAGARRLVPDLALQAVRGQSVVVTNPGVHEFFVEVSNEPEMTCYFPHGEHVVLGGVSLEGDWSTEPDPAVAEQILARCAAVQPLFSNAEVVEHRVGTRPTRAPIRVEATELGGARLVHCYGHGGLGVTLSWGSARQAAALAAPDRLSPS